MSGAEHGSHRCLTVHSLSSQCVRFHSESCPMTADESPNDEGAKWDDRMTTYKPGSSSMRIFFRLNIACTALSSQSVFMSSAQPTTTSVTSAALRTRASAARASSCASCGRMRNRSSALRHPSRDRTANSEGRGRTAPDPGLEDSSTAAAPRRR